MAMRSLAAALCAALLGAACASPQAGAAAAPAPLAPVFTNYSYFDHHWIQWLPDHPVYEAIEAQVYDGPDDRRFIRVFLTERAPPKRQTYYFNDAETAERWSGGRAFARDIDLDHTPNAGGAHDLTLRFADANGAPLEWTMRFDPTDAPQSYGAGLRPSQGHAADTAYIFHYYGRSAVAREARLSLDRESFIYRRDDADLARRGPKTGYTAGSYTPVVRLGVFACDQEGMALRCDEDRIFRPAAGGLRTAPFGYAGLSAVELQLTQGAAAAYVHRFGDHSFRFDFSPPLPPLASLRGGERFAYSVSLDDDANLVTGSIISARSGDDVVLTWTPASPAWMAAQPMTTIVSPRESGYTLSLRAGEVQ